MVASRRDGVGPGVKIELKRSVRKVAMLGLDAGAGLTRLFWIGRPNCEELWKIKSCVVVSTGSSTILAYVHCEESRSAVDESEGVVMYVVRCRPAAAASPVPVPF